MRNGLADRRRFFSALAFRCTRTVQRYALSGRRVLPQAHKKEETNGFLLFVNLPLCPWIAWTQMVNCVSIAKGNDSGVAFA